MSSPLTADELRELRRLHVQLGRRVDAMFAGDYRSAIRGRGMEFDEVRNYVPGDDVRHIDWNVTARTNEPFVKIFREERQNTVILAVDVSGSTRVGSGGRDGRTDRRLQIARIAGGIAFAGIRNRDRVGLVTFSDDVEQWLPPRPTRSHVWAIIQQVFQADANRHGTSLGQVGKFLTDSLRRRTTIVLVSDFLDEAPWDRVWRGLAKRHEVHAILVHDALDHSLPSGLFEVIDSETGMTQLVDGAAWGGASKVEARFERLIRTGVAAMSLSTQDDVLQTLHRHFRARVSR